LRRLFNDPLFLRTPRGVVPTARAVDLAAPVAEALAKVRQVMSTTAPFDPKTARRRFVIAAPDGSSAVLFQSLLTKIAAEAPGIDVGLRQLLPRAGAVEAEDAWQEALADLDAGVMDAAVLPLERAPARFHVQLLYEEDFVIACRAGHAYANAPRLERFCSERHLLVSHSGERFGFVDRALAAAGQTRRIALTVPNFFFALAALAESDLIAALPRMFVALHGRRLGIVASEAPLALPRFRMCVIAPKVALMDSGIAWLLARLAQSRPAAP
jgi:DNA-binding transcriptional LysR family regulator